MADVAIKIIGCHTQPKEGFGRVFNGGIQPTSSGINTSSGCMLAPTINLGPTVTYLDAKYDNRLDDPRYYSGDTSS